MLGVITADGRGQGDRLFAMLARTLAGQGLRLAGAVQENTDHADRRACDMDLHLLGSPDRVRISQNLGPLSQGCRLDPDGVERAAARVAIRLAAGVDLVIVNKFGKQEADGGGFRQVIGQALAAGIPVLTQVKPVNRAAFDAFAGGLADQLPPDPRAVLRWVAAQCPGFAHVPAIGAALRQ